MTTNFLENNSPLVLSAVSKALGYAKEELNAERVKHRCEMDACNEKISNMEMALESAITELDQERRDRLQCEEDKEQLGKSLAKQMQERDASFNHLRECLMHELEQEKRERSRAEIAANVSAKRAAALMEIVQVQQRPTNPLDEIAKLSDENKALLQRLAECEGENQQHQRRIAELEANNGQRFLEMRPLAAGLHSQTASVHLTLTGFIAQMETKIQNLEAEKVLLKQRLTLSNSKLATSVARERDALSCAAAAVERAKILSAELEVERTSKANKKITVTKEYAL